MDFKIENNSHFLFCYHLAKELFSPLPDGTLQLDCRQDGQTVQACAQYFCGEQHLTFTHKTDIMREFGLERAENLAVGTAVWKLFTKLSRKRPPYGILVGVRPTKVALYYLNHGLSDGNVILRLTRDYFVTEEKARLLLSLAKTEKRTVDNLKPSDAVLYLSVPFCPSRCKYCSFISQSAPKQLGLIEDYLTQMIEELKETGRLFSAIGKTLKSVYLGGGTPGILSAKQLDQLFFAFESVFARPENLEFTAELGRPDTITKEKLEVLKDHGITRVCINPQTLSDEVLRQNGRSHSADDYLKAYFLARKTGAFQINSDLIAGLCGDTPEGFSGSLDRILSLEPENVTIHCLCKKRASDDTAPDEDPNGLWTMAISDAMHRCINHGQIPYYLYRQKNTIANLENIGYAKDSCECLYNIAMMEDLCDVFSVGAGAITKLVTKKGAHKKIRRFASYKYPTEYLKYPDKLNARIRAIQSLFQENVHD